MDIKQSQKENSENYPSSTKNERNEHKTIRYKFKSSN